MKKLFFFWKEIMATFWFLPVMILGFSVFLSVALVYLDSIITISHEGLLRYFLVNSSDSARIILSTISGAMIGVAGTVFSVTLVALTLASSQFGPRLIKNFMYVRLNQVVLGSYISTYLYCLLVLNSVRESDDYSFIPSISILVAILAAMANIILLIIFIHQIATSIQADKVVADISGVIFKQVEILFPETMGEENEKEENIDVAGVIVGYRKHVSIKSPSNGYLQYVDGETLIKTVTKHDSLIKVNYRPGSYLVKGQELGLLYLKADLEEDTLDDILNQFVFGEIKTAQQDLEFSINQMVEIAVRALSTGVNDPFTAIACIDNLSAALAFLTQAKFPSNYRFDDEGTLRAIADTFEFEGVLDASFNQIRQSSGGIPAVLIRLLEALNTINEFTRKESHTKAIIKHAEMVLRLGKETINEKNDLDDLTQRAEKIFKKQRTIGFSST